MGDSEREREGGSDPEYISINLQLNFGSFISPTASDTETISMEKLPNKQALNITYWNAMRTTNEKNRIHQNIIDLNNTSKQKKRWGNEMTRNNDAFFFFFSFSLSCV